VLAEILRQCVKDGENARVDNADYLRVFGISDRSQRAGDIWRTLAKASGSNIAPHRAALDVILNEGTLANRLLQSVGPDVNPTTLLATYRRLCDCLAHGRMFHAAS
jgi:carboxylate-amine ligase